MLAQQSVPPIGSQITQQNLVFFIECIKNANLIFTVQVLNHVRVREARKVKLQGIKTEKLLSTPPLHAFQNNILVIKKYMNVICCFLF